LRKLPRMSAEGTPQLSPPTTGRRRKSGRDAPRRETLPAIPADAVPTDIGPIDSVLGFHMQRAAFVFAPSAASERGFPRWEMTILSVVSVNPGITQVMVSKALSIDQGNLISRLNNLIQRGLLLKAVPAKNRRIRALTLTTAGQARLYKLLLLTRKLEAQRLECLSKPEQQALLNLLRRVHAPSGPSNPLVERPLRRGINRK
jgi:DNA-binding MarR family transcriptional regulator